MKKRTRLYYGFELEVALNKDSLIKTFNCGSYHNSLKIPGSKYWRAETDGSLRFEHTMDGGRWSLMELTTKPLGRLSINKAITELKSMFKDGLRFSDCMMFNKTMGLHVHFHVSNKQLKRFVCSDHESILYDLVLKVMRSKGLSESFIKTFSDNYYRYYASKESNGRYSSLNTQTIYPTIEWRSFNALPVKSWLELRLMFDVAKDTLKLFYEMMEQTHYLIEKEIKYTDDEDNNNKTVLLEDVYTEIEINGV